MNDIDPLFGRDDLRYVEETIELDSPEFERVSAAAEEGWEYTAGAVVYDDRGRVALVRNGWSDGWIPPGGSVEPGEEFEAAAAREVREETGLVVDVEEPAVVSEQTFVHDGEAVVGHYVLYAAYAAETELDEDPGVPGETIEAVDWFDEVPEDAMDRERIEAVLSEQVPSR